LWFSFFGEFLFRDRFLMRGRMKKKKKSMISRLGDLHRIANAKDDNDESKCSMDDDDDDALFAMAFDDELRALQSMCDRFEEALLDCDTNEPTSRHRAKCIAIELRRRLKQMRARCTTIDDDDVSPAQRRMCENMMHALTSRFVVLMQQLQHGMIKSMVTVDSGEQMQVQLDQVDRRPQQQRRRRAAIVHVQEQRQDLIELERAMIELHELFADLAANVDSQREAIDNIERNAMQACVWTGTAVEHLRHANCAAKKHRRNRCVACVAVSACCTAGGAAAATQVLPLIGSTACTIQ
jgi:hypothetical protein